MDIALLVEYKVVVDKKEKEILTPTRKLYRLWRCPSIDIGASE